MGGLDDVGPLWLLGCGAMGGALLARWRGAGLRDVAVIDPAPRDPPAGVRVGSAPPPGGVPQVLVLAIKPQHWTIAVEPLRRRLVSETLVVSIMAGVARGAIAAHLGCRRVVRAMPNTPARIGRAVTALYGDPSDAAARKTTTALMDAAGTTLWLEDEGQFDAVTGVSGSGPAYVFAFIEALTAAGTGAGLPPKLAATLARATVTGAAALADEDADASPAALRAAVTSPGGTTAAGYAALDGEGALTELLRETVAAATARSRELGRLG